jgi:hypothetical protein
MSLLASQPLQLPNKWIPREFITREYENHMKASQELKASLNYDAVNAEVSELSQSPGGLNFMAKENRNPLLRESLYESTTGNLLQNYKLSQGETAEFWADIDVAAAAIGVGGLPGQVEIKSDYTRVDTRMFAAAPYVRWNVSNLTKFDILGATQQRLKASLMLQEAAAFYRLLVYASGLRSQQGTTFGLVGTSAASNNAPTSVPTSTAGRLSVDQLAIGTANFGQRLIKGPKKLLINPGRQADLVLFNYGGPGTGGNGFFAPNIQEMLLNKGNSGSFLGNDVYEDVVVPMVQAAFIDSIIGAPSGSENVGAYLLGPSEYVGVKVIRTDLVIETMKDATRFADVFAGWMDLGYYIRFVKALQRLTV